MNSIQNKQKQKEKKPRRHRTASDGNGTSGAIPDIFLHHTIQFNAHINIHLWFPNQIGATASVRYFISCRFHCLTIHPVAHVLNVQHYSIYRLGSGAHLTRARFTKKNKN